VIWAIAIGIILLGLVVVLNSLFPGALSDENNQMSLTHSLLWLVLLGSSVIIGYRGRAQAAFKHALVWIIIALGLVLAYSYRHDVFAIASRVGGELMPTRPMVMADGHVELRASDGGHFQADVLINGATVRFLVDTGATTMALAPDDAERIGIDLDTLDFDRPVSTANGRAYVAYVRLDQVEIGPIQLADVRSSVHRDGLNQSLLGMNVLDRLSGFERTGDRLILRP